MFEESSEPISPETRRQPFRFKVGDKVNGRDKDGNVEPGWEVLRIDQDTQEVMIANDAKRSGTTIRWSELEELNPKNDG